MPKKKATSKKKTAKKKVVKKKTTSKISKTDDHKVASEKAAKAAAMAMKDIIARARDHFRQAPADRVFVLANGKVLKDLRELADSFEDMAEPVFAHHVNDQRHDFANWVHEILHEKALAEQLREAHRDPLTQQNTIYRHIVRRVW